MVSLPLGHAWSSCQSTRQLQLPQTWHRPLPSHHVPSWTFQTPVGYLFKILMLAINLPSAESMSNNSAVDTHICLIRVFGENCLIMIYLYRYRKLMLTLPPGKFSRFFCRLLTFFQNQHIWKILSGIPSVSNSLDPVQARHFVGPDLSPSCLQMSSADDTMRQIGKVQIVLAGTKSWVHVAYHTYINLRHPYLPDQGTQ